MSKAKLNKAFSIVDAVNWQMCLYNAVTNFLVFLANQNGARSIEKVVTLLVILPTIQQIILLVLSLSNCGCYRGLKFVFYPKISELLDFGHLWSPLFIQFILLVGFGIGE